MKFIEYKNFSDFRGASADVYDGGPITYVSYYQSCPVCEEVPEPCFSFRPNGQRPSEKVTEIVSDAETVELAWARVMSNKAVMDRYKLLATI